MVGLLLMAKAAPQKLQQRIYDLGRQVDDLAQKRDALRDKLDAMSQQAT
jgi:outer membrane murein-binding lipoprotein Lpp